VVKGSCRRAGLRGAVGGPAPERVRSGVLRAPPVYLAFHGACLEAHALWTLGIFLSRCAVCAQGSAGTVVVTATEALLWTDGRYFLQAQKELGREWRLMRAGTGSTPEMPTYLKDNLAAGARVGIDPLVRALLGYPSHGGSDLRSCVRAQLHSATSARALRSTLASGGKKLVSLTDNLVDRVWGAARPAAPQAPTRVHAMQWAGVSVTTKLANLRREMRKAGADVLVVSQLDEVAWLLNMRGADVDNNPVTLAYALVHTDSAAVYCDPTKVVPDVAAQLAAASITVRPYAAAVEDLRAAAAAGRRVWADPAKVSLALFDAVEEAALEGSQVARAKVRRRGDKKPAAGATAPAAAAREPPLLENASPISMAKAVKNAQELAGMREAHLRDAVALAQFFAWLEAAMAEGQTVTEASAAAHLASLRGAQTGFFEPSFPTIAGCGSNGAIIHYRPMEGSCATLTPGSLLLLDSGGQYDCGTTDVTRTVHLGPASPSAAQRDAFTRVLQGHIALDTAVFPEGTPGFVLDAFARRALWAAGLDYRHGTGHGVGAALNVHEGPHGIAPRFSNLTGLVAGMVVSNEPGFYLDGQWGIRIENLLAVREAPTASRFGGTTFLCFERLTLVPIQAKMLALELLSAADIKWLDEYHTQVWDTVSPRCEGAARDWLRLQTQPMAVQLANSAA